MGFVLHHGKPWKPAKWPFSFRRGKMKECFHNAFMLMMDHPSLEYVEGFAAGVIPVHHAWCVNKDGEVVDPTWRDSEASLYYGVQFRRDFVIRMMQTETAYVSILDRWTEGLPMENGKYPAAEWKPEQAI